MGKQKSIYEMEEIRLQKEKEKKPEKEEKIRVRIYKTLTTRQIRMVKNRVKKGWTQDKIAREIKVSRQRVATYLKTAKLGKRSKFREDIETFRRAEKVGYKEAFKRVKYQPYWFEKRQARLKGKEKARDAMREKHISVRYKDVAREDAFPVEEMEGLLDAAGYD